MKQGNDEITNGTLQSRNRMQLPCTADEETRAGVGEQPGRRACGLRTPFIGDYLRLEEVTKLRDEQSSVDSGLPIDCSRDLFVNFHLTIGPVRSQLSMKVLWDEWPGNRGGRTELRINIYNNIYEIRPPITYPPSTPSMRHQYTHPVW